MKELEKTKRISIVAVLFILVILIGLLSYKRPKYLYTINSKQMLEQVFANNYLVSLNELSEIKNVALIDIRSPFEFNKGSLENAINIYTPDILLDSNIDIFNKLKQENTTVLLYGANPNEALGAYMILYQLGYDNLKILSINNSYSQNKLITSNAEIEKSAPDIKAFIEESIKNAEIEPTKQIVQPAPKKTIIPVKKKKKMPTEGGC